MSLDVVIVDDVLKHFVCVCVCDMLIQTYRQLGTVVHAAMSADSSCRGLRSPRDGPIVLELTRGQHHLNNL